MKAYHCLYIFLLVLLSACVPTVHYFNVMPYIETHHREVAAPLTVMLDEQIPNNHFFNEGNLQYLRVEDFRHSLHLSLLNTFESSFEEVHFSSEIAEEGWTLALLRIRPFNEPVTMGESVFNKSLIRYEGIVYHNGKKVKVIDDEALSEDIAFSAHDREEVFKDSISQMCKQLYVSMIEVQKNLLTKQ
ncbi:MAG: hypothetical protein ACLFT3_13415 [Cyclobacteriaceae bacterium]